MSEKVFDHSPETKAKLRSVISVFETGRPALNYAALATHADAPGGGRQLTYGWFQMTDGSGSLDRCLRLAYANAGMHAEGADWKIVAKWIPRLARASRASYAEAAASDELKDALERLATNPAMQKAQRQVFDEDYLAKAIHICAGSDFHEPLSALVVLDSLVHGSFRFIRDQILADLPEREWIVAYSTKRQNWLKHHPRRILAATRCRPASFLHLAKEGNWNLDLPFSLVMGGRRGTVEIRKEHLSV